MTIDVRAAGVNPADYKAVAGNRGRDEANLPLPIGFEVAGVVSAPGPDTGFDDRRRHVLAFRVRGGYTSAITVPAKDVFAKPARARLPRGREPAARRLHRRRHAARRAGRAGQTVRRPRGVGSGRRQPAPAARAARRARDRHGVGARLRLGPPLRRRAGEPTATALEARAARARPGRLDAAFDCVGTDEAVDTSLALVRKRDRARHDARRRRAQRATGSPRSAA